MIRVDLQREMATAIVLSATFMQGKQGRQSSLACDGVLSAKPSWRQNVALHHQEDAPLHCIQSHTETPKRTSSRRDLIALFLPLALDDNARAAESVHLKERLKMEQLGHASRGQWLSSNLCLGEFSEFLLAYLGTLKTSSRSSLGFLGFLVFGLLFLREKQANAANAASLEDVELRLQKAETELSSQTRSCIMYKLEESLLANGSERDISVDDALQCQLSNVKFSNFEKGQKLTVSKRTLATLQQQVMSLTASIVESKRSCSSLLGNVGQQFSLRQGIEVEVQSVNVDLQSIAEAIGKLTVAMDDQEQISNKLIEENVAVESSLELLNKKIVDLQAKFESLNKFLDSSNSTVGFLSKELHIATTRNTTLELKLNEVLGSLQQERALFEKVVIEHNDLLITIGKRADVCCIELLSQQDELNELITAKQLTSEQGVLDKVLRDKQSTLDNARETLCLDLERLRRILENEMPNLHQQLQQERERHVTLQSAFKDSTIVSGNLLRVPADLEDQVNVQKKLAERLETELHISREALSLLRREILDLQDSMQSRMSSQVHLNDELTRLNEVQQSHCQALKKEKRAAAYARKQLTVTRKILVEESQVMDELRKELENLNKLTEESKLQIALQANQLEKATTNTGACLAEDDILVLEEQMAQQIDSSGSDTVPTCVAKRSRNRRLAKRAISK